MPKKNPRRKLDSRQKKLIKALQRGATYAEAALVAGYSPRNPRQSAHDALKGIAKKMPDLFERHGLDDDSFIRDHILPALNATEVKAHFSGKKFHYSEPMVAWGPRTTTHNLVARLKGMSKEEQPQTAAGVKVVIINAGNRPPRPVVNVTPQTPALDAPEEGNGHHD